MGRSVVGIACRRVTKARRFAGANRHSSAEVSSRKPQAGEISRTQFRQKRLALGDAALRRPGPFFWRLFLTATVVRRPFLEGAFPFGFSRVMGGNFFEGFRLPLLSWRLSRGYVVGNKGLIAFALRQHRLACA